MVVRRESMVGESCFRTSARLDMLAFMHRGEGFVLFHVCSIELDPWIQDPASRIQRPASGCNAFGIQEVYRYLLLSFFGPETRQARSCVGTKEDGGNEVLYYFVVYVDV